MEMGAILYAAGTSGSSDELSDLERIYKKYENFDHILPDGRLAKYLPIELKAALSGDRESLRVLYKYGANFNKEYNGQSILYIITPENVLSEVEANDVIEFLLNHGARYDSLNSAISSLANFGLVALPAIECAIRVEKDRRQLNEALQMVIDNHIIPLQDQEELKGETVKLLLQYGARFAN